MDYSEVFYKMADRITDIELVLKDINLSVGKTDWWPTIVQIVAIIVAAIVTVWVAGSVAKEAAIAGVTETAGFEEKSKRKELAKKTAYRLRKIREAINFIFPNMTENSLTNTFAADWKAKSHYPYHMLDIDIPSTELGIYSLGVLDNIFAYKTIVILNRIRYALPEHKLAGRSDNGDTPTVDIEKLMASVAWTCGLDKLTRREIKSISNDQAWDAFKEYFESFEKVIEEIEGIIHN